MNDALELKLIECLEALEAGASLDEVLRRYPEEAEELRPLLETAVSLDNLNLQPSLAAQTKSRETFLAHAAALKENKTRRRRSPFLFGLRRLVMPLATFIVLIFFGVGLIAASAPAVPGDALYGTKRLVENIQLGLTTDPTIRATLSAEFNQERIQEIETLLARGSSADVSFEGPIEKIEPDYW
ncbi:MAG: hypothetical protein D6706_05820, partial [Chloroflexi bacterium]